MKPIFWKRCSAKMRFSCFNPAFRVKISNFHFVLPFPIHRMKNGIIPRNKGMIPYFLIAVDFILLQAAEARFSAAPAPFAVDRKDRVHGAGVSRHLKVNSRFHA